MTYLDEDALAAVRFMTRERKLTMPQRLAIYAFAQRGVPTKVIARTFSVSGNAIRYIVNPNKQGLASHEAIKEEFERLGVQHVWTEIVTDAQIESINDGLRKLYNGKELDDRGYRRVNRRGARARRARTTTELSQAAGNDASGNA